MKIGKSALSPETLTERKQNTERGAERPHTTNHIDSQQDRRDARVDVSLSKLIQSELSVDQIAQERRARVEELKIQIQSGKYNPSSDSVADSFVRELGAELHFAAAFASDSEGE